MSEIKTPEQIANEAIDGNLHLARPYSRANVMRLIESAIEADRAQRGGVASRVRAVIEAEIGWDSPAVLIDRIRWALDCGEVSTYSTDQEPDVTPSGHEAARASVAERSANYAAELYMNLHGETPLDEEVQVWSTDDLELAATWAARKALGLESYEGAGDAS